VNRLFRAKGAKYLNYWTDSNQILHNDRHHQVVFVGGPNTCPTNPRWRTAVILKKTVKSRYLCNRSTDFDEMWYDGASWPFLSGRSLKFQILKIQDGDGCHIENHKNRDITAMV